MFTPGCTNDNTCATRGRVNITGTLTSSTQSSNSPLSTELFQTNNFDKYDEVYSGYVDATGSFRPSVTLAPVAGQSGPLIVVAQRVRFQLLQANSGNLNGLFSYDPAQENFDANSQRSNIDIAGRSLSPSNNALVSTISVVDSTVYVGGNFSGNNGLRNIFSIGDGNATSLPGNGLNDRVETIYRNQTTLFVGGSFTNTQDGNNPDLKGVAAYSTRDQRWQPLGGGVNGTVTNIVPFSLNLTTGPPEDVLGISGFFDAVNEFRGNASIPVNNFAVWVISRQNWLHNLNLGTLAIEGTLRARANLPGASPVYAGSISSQSLSANGAVVLNGNGQSLQPFPVNIRPHQSQSALQKRAISSGANTTGIVTAAYFKENGMNLTILAGHFSTTGSDGSNITNLLIIDGKDNDVVTGLNGDLNNDSIFTALGVVDATLFAGGRVSGTINGDRIAGVVAYDLRAKKYADQQPVPLQGQNVTVNAIAPRPRSKEVYVGGNFASAGALSCSALCIWKTDVNQWSAPGGDLSGTVTSITWISDSKLIVAGNLTSGGNNTYVLSYDSQNNRFENIPGAQDLPGPVTAVCRATDDGSQIWVSGAQGDNTPYLQRFDGDKWLAAPNHFSVGTSIRGIQVLSLSNDHDKADLIDADQDLLILGTVNLTDFGTASGVLFNGTTYIPLLLSTTSEGTPGSLSQVFVENPQSFFKSKSK